MTPWIFLAGCHYCVAFSFHSRRDAEILGNMKAASLHWGDWKGEAVREETPKFLTCRQNQPSLGAYYQLFKNNNK